MEKNQTQATTPRPAIELFQLLREDGRTGDSIPKHQYDTWSHFILSTLATEEEFTLNDILESAYKQVSASGEDSNHNKTGWYVLQVKRDLEARALIKVTPSPSRKHSFLIQLTRQGMNKIHYQIQLDEWSENY